MTDHHLSELGNRLDLSKVVKKTDCQELLEVHRNVIDVKSIAFLMILLAPEVSFVTLHMRWHKGCCSNSIQKKMIFAFQMLIKEQCVYDKLLRRHSA